MLLKFSTLAGGVFIEYTGAEERPLRIVAFVSIMLVGRNTPTTRTL